MLNDLNKLQFYKYVKRLKLSLKIVEVYGIGIEKVYLTDRIEKPIDKNIFRLIQAIDITALIGKFQITMSDKMLIDYICEVHEFVFDKEFENFSYVEII